MASHIHHVFIVSCVIYPQLPLVRTILDIEFTTTNGCPEIIEHMQSSLMDTTNVHMIIDDDKSFFANLTSLRILKMFSNQKTFSLETFTEFKETLESSQKSNTEGETFSKSEINRSRDGKVPQEIEDKPEIDENFFRRRKTRNFTYAFLSDSTSFVLFLKNLSSMKTFENVFIENPSIVKIVYLYKACQQGDISKTIFDEIKRISSRFWEDFRVLYIYFIVYCPEMEKLNVNKKSTKGRQMLQEEIDRTFKFGNLMGSVIVYDPFYVKDALKGSNNSQYGRLREIKSSENCNFVSKSLIRKIFRLNGYRLRIVFFANSMAVQRGDVPFMSRHLTPEQLENRFNLLETYFGPEPEIVAELSRRMGFTPLIRLPTDNNSYGFRQTDGIFNGALGDIIYRRADIALNGYFIKDYETRELEFTTTLQDDKLCIVVKTPGLIPDSLLLFKVFSPPVWLLLIGTFMLASCMYSFLLYIQAKTSDGKGSLPFKSSNETYNKVSAVLSQCTRIVAVLLNAPLSYAFDTSSYERVFVSLCLLWGLNVIGSFQGSLVDVYTTPKSYPSIHSLQELDESELPIHVRHWGLTVDIFGTEPPGTPLGNLRKKLVPAQGEDNLTLEISKTGKMTEFIRAVELPQVVLGIPYRQDGIVPIYIMKECPRTYTLANMVPKSSALLETTNHYLNLFASNGLVSKWINDVIYIFKYYSDFKNREFVHDTNITLNLSHLQLAFFTLFLGLFISLIIFIIEVFLERGKVNVDLQFLN